MEKTKDTYAIVTNTILSALEKGIVPWQRPWNAEINAPRSLSTKKPYRGGNIFILLATSWLKGYTSPWWGTYKQINELGGKVKTGEHGTPVSYYKFLVKETDEGEETIIIHRYYTVFNVEQAEGLPDFQDKLPEKRLDFVPIEQAQLVAENYRTGANLAGINYGGGEAAYYPSLDKIAMPEPETFCSVPSFYSVLFHEIGHSTGHETRLKRDLKNLFGDHLYSKEELVAELTQAFVMSNLQLGFDVQNTAAYIDSWSTALKENPRWFASAGSKAQKASDYIMSFTTHEEFNLEEEAENV